MGVNNPAHLTFATVNTVCHNGDNDYLNQRNSFSLIKRYKVYERLTTRTDYIYKL